MTISILVLGAPFDSQASYTAYRFAEAALSLNQTIHRIFFYQAGIHSASVLACPPRDELDLYKAWQDLKSTYELDLVVCIAAAARRGMIDQTEARRHNKNGANMAGMFELSGLGQLIDAISESDKFITFGV
jgi:tRNA 2-thiouridine synthesizing protein D